jgi:hypothetical protein
MPAGQGAGAGTSVIVLAFLKRWDYMYLKRGECRRPLRPAEAPFMHDYRSG